MKKLIALLLCLAMVAAVFAGCSGSNDGTETTTAPTQTTAAPETTAPTTTAAPVVDAEAIEYTPLYYWSFDDASNLTAVEQVALAADTINDGATYDIGESAHEIMITETGVVGNALYLDGTYGVKLNLDGLNITDGSYTLSFWLNATRLSTFGPTLQIGRNMGDSGDTTSDSYRCVTWLNFTQAEWGTSSAKLFPVYWNRNSDYDVWPWGACYDDAVHGKQEWLLVTLVVDGNDYVCADDGLPRVGTQYYLNGELVFDASADLAYYQGVSPEILTGDGIEGYLGVNYWDTVFKGYFDELYIYDEALTAGQVKSLYEQGDTSVEPVAPEGGNEIVEAPLPEITVDSNAIDVLGTTARDNGWWTDNTGAYELAEGASMTMKLNNYSNGEANYKNFVLVLTNTAVTTDVIASGDNYTGYAEYAVIRPDAFGWGDASYAATFTTSWGDDWAGWLDLMKDADVTVVLTRSGSDVTMDFTFVGADGTTMTETAVVTSTLTADAPCYVFVGGEGAYIELLSVE